MLLYIEPRINYIHINYIQFFQLKFILNTWYLFSNVIFSFNLMNLILSKNI